MKRNLFLFLLVLGCSGFALGKTLPLSPQGKAQAALYLDFLQAAQAEVRLEENYCDQYRSLLPRAPQDKYLLRLLMVCALSQDNIEEAEQYISYIEQGDNSAEDWSVYAFYLWRKGRLKEAQETYEKALAAAPDDLRILYQYVLLLTYIDPDRAAEKLQEHKENYPSIAHVIDYEIGNIYRRRRQPLKALEYYNAATRQDPTYPEPYLARAEMYEKASQFFLMLHELESLESIGYESAAMYSRMGSVYVLVRDDARAKDYFQKAKTLEPADIPAGYFLALYAEQEGDFLKAAHYLRETADFAQDAGKWLQVAFYQQQAGQMKEALSTLKEAYKRFEQNVEIGYFYALALQDSGKNRQAVRVLKRILQTNASYEQARLAYAFALESLGKYKEMEEQLRLVLEQNPQNAAAYNLLGFSLADRNERLEEAQELITKALEIQPQDRAFIDSLAWVYYRQGNYDQALKLLGSLDEDFINNNADVAYHLGAVYAALGKPEQAKPYLERASQENREAKNLLKKLPRSAS